VPSQTRSQTRDLDHKAGAPRACPSTTATVANHGRIRDNQLPKWAGSRRPGYCVKPNMRQGDSRLVEQLGTIATFMLSAAAFITSLVALRFSLEQARSYLFPVPAIYVGASSSIMVRNFGSGPMLNVYIELHVRWPVDHEDVIHRRLPSLANGESAEVLSTSVMQSGPILSVTALIDFDNIRRKSRRRTLRLTSDQLGAISR
jgi:hypothetical protein